MEPHVSQASLSHPSSGARAASVDAATLPLRAVSVRARARGGIASVVLEQTFANPHDEPLSVVYKMPLPADGALAGYRFRIGDRVVRGEVDRRVQARERFERAVLEGHTAGLVEQERDDVFTQELGNVPPHAEVVVELEVDQPLGWTHEGAWELRFPLASAPRYLGPAGRVGDAEAVTKAVSLGPLPVHAHMQLTIEDVLAAGETPRSSTHVVTCSARDKGIAVDVGEGGSLALDRDVVISWARALVEPGIDLEVARLARETRSDDAQALLSIVPPARTTALAPVPRDLTLLLDTSGSMSGAPLDQMKRVAAALIDTLGERDSLEMVEFSNEPAAFDAAPQRCTPALKARARAWVLGLQAGGGTEMTRGIERALANVRPEAQRQVVLLTDGHIGFEREVITRVVAKLSAGSRLHTVGVGSSVNRGLLQPLARAGRGAEIVIGIDEDAERGVARLVRATAGPQLVDVQLSGSALRESIAGAPCDVLEGAPLRLPVALSPQGGELTITARTERGTWSRTLRVAPTARGEGRAAIARLFARECVAAAELRLAAGAEPSHIDAELETLGLGFQIATRVTSWVAISEERTVDPNAPTRRVEVPQQLPYGMSAEGVGLRAATQALASFSAGIPHAPAPAPSARAGAPSAPFSPKDTLDEEAAPPSQAPATPSRDGRLLSRAMKKLNDLFSGEPTDAAEKSDGAKAKGSGAGLGDVFRLPASKAPRSYRGRVVFRDQDVCILELEIERYPYEHDPAHTTVVVDGGPATLDVSRSTHAGSYGIGTRIRIALKIGLEREVRTLVMTGPSAVVRILVA